MYAPLLRIWEIEELALVKMALPQAPLLVGAGRAIDNCQFRACKTFCARNSWLIYQEVSSTGQICCVVYRPSLWLSSKVLSRTSLRVNSQLINKHYRSSLRFHSSRGSISLLFKQTILNQPVNGAAECAIRKKLWNCFKPYYHYINAHCVLARAYQLFQTWLLYSPGEWIGEIDQNTWIHCANPLVIQIMCVHSDIETSPFTTFWSTTLNPWTNPLWTLLILEDNNNIPHIC